MARRLACSDIHGEGHRLLRVLEKAHYEPGIDRLFLLGDYIDRGTDSKRTVEIVQELQRDGAVVLKGNHDDMAVKATRYHEWYELWWGKGGDTTWRDFGGWPPSEVLQWLDDLPMYHEEPDCILVHAGLKPGISLRGQRPDGLLWIRREFIHEYSGKRVIFGHCPTSWITGDLNYLDVWNGPDKTGIDTGAAYGGRLTLLDIDSGETWWA